MSFQPPDFCGSCEWLRKALAHTLLQFRGITLHPPPQGDVIGRNPPLSQKLFHIPVRNRKAQVSPDREEDHLGFKLAPLEQAGNRGGEGGPPTSGEKLLRSASVRKPQGDMLNITQKWYGLEPTIGLVERLSSRYTQKQGSMAGLK
jgi:hypothetical protein